MSRPSGALQPPLTRARRAASRAAARGAGGGLHRHQRLPPTAARPRRDIGSGRVPSLGVASRPNRGRRAVSACLEAGTTGRPRVSPLTQRRRLLRLGGVAARGRRKRCGRAVPGGGGGANYPGTHITGPCVDTRRRLHSAGGTRGRRRRRRARHTARPPCGGDGAEPLRRGGACARGGELPPCANSPTAPPPLPSTPRLWST